MNMFSMMSMKSGTMTVMGLNKALQEIATCTCPECQVCHCSLQPLRQLRPPQVTRVHRDEDADLKSPKGFTVISPDPRRAYPKLLWNSVRSSSRAVGSSVQV